MESLRDVFIWIIPIIVVALIIVLLVYFLMRAILKSDEKRRQIENQVKNRDTLMIRLQACERLTLFLERIHPVQLVFRVNKAGMDLNSFKNALHNTIREEYEHNIAQQLYISDRSWGMLVAAKEELISVINTVFIDLEDGVKTTDFAKRIIEKWMELDKDPVALAKANIKKEAAELF
jgi:heme/copper-type cytochrome/quinol oxidase subunit 2